MGKLNNQLKSEAENERIQTLFITIVTTYTKKKYLKHTTKKHFNLFVNHLKHISIQIR